MKRERSRFVAVDTRRGGRETIIEYVDVLDTGGVLAPKTSDGIRRSYALANGAAVIDMEDGTFEVVGTKRILRRV